MKDQQTTNEILNTWRGLFDEACEIRVDAISIIKSRFVDQATRLTKGKDLNLWSRFVPIIKRYTEGLDPWEQQGLIVYIEDQFELINQDYADFFAKRDPNDPKDVETVLRMMRRRARLRADQIVRMIEQAQARQKLKDEGAKYFKWQTQEDNLVRDEHKAINGQVYLLSQGHPEFGFPGDPHNCRCVAVPVDIPEDLRGDNDSYKPPAAVREAARLALEARAKLPPSKRGMTSVGIARARDLANGRGVSVETLKRMLSYFARHEIDKEAKSWSDEDWSKGRQAWFGWGGDAGRKWAQGIIDDLMRGDMEIRLDELEIDIARARETDEGWLEVEGAVLARAGVLTYTRGDGSTIRELRDPAVIHSQDALASYNGKPLLLGSHPKDELGNVTLLNRQNTVNFPPVGSIRNARADTARDPDTGRDVPVTRADVLIWDPHAIAAARAGKRQFSCGYSVQVEAAAPGATGQGVSYDAKQTIDRGNHVAMVDVARAGNITEFRLDSRGAILTGSNKGSLLGGGTMSQYTLEGVTGEVDPALIPLIKSLEAQVSELKSNGAQQLTRINELEGEVAVHTAAAAARGDEGARIEAAVKERLELQAQAAPLLPAGYEFEGKTAAMIRGDAVKHSTGLEGLEGAALEGAYKTALTIKAKAKEGQAALANLTRPSRGDSDNKPRGLQNAYERFVARTHKHIK
jgi:SPP1 gp7 family putative phage head morphogenesis protein